MIQTENVTNMSSMFWGCYSLDALDVSQFNTSKVTDMSDMFSGCKKVASLDVTGFDTSNVTNMSRMFYGCNGLTKLDLSNFDTSAVNNMAGMFQWDEGFTDLDLSSFDTSNVESMWQMFSDANKLITIRVSEKWSMDKVTNWKDMFNQCKKLIGGNGTVFDSAFAGGEYARIDKEGEPGYFTYKAADASPAKEASTGDLDGDGEITAGDAQNLLAAYAEILAGGQSTLTDAQKTACDIDKDGEITAADAQYILIYYTENTVAGNPVSWDDIVKK